MKFNNKQVCRVCNHYLEVVTLVPHCAVAADHLTLPCRKPPRSDSAPVNDEKAAKADAGSVYMSHSGAHAPASVLTACHNAYFFSKQFLIKC